MSEYITLDTEQVEAVEELSDVREQIKSLRGLEKELRDGLLELLEAAQATRGMTASGVQAVSLRTGTRTTVAKDKLEALFPEVFEKVKKETVTKTVVLG